MRSKVDVGLVLVVASWELSRFEARSASRLLVSGPPLWSVPPMKRLTSERPSRTPDPTSVAQRKRYTKRPQLANTMFLLPPYSFVVALRAGVNTAESDIAARASTASSVSNSLSTRPWIMIPRIAAHTTPAMPRAGAGSASRSARTWRAMTVKAAFRIFSRVSAGIGWLFNQTAITLVKPLVSEYWFLDGVRPAPPVHLWCARSAGRRLCGRDRSEPARLLGLRRWRAAGHRRLGRGLEPGDCRRRVVAPGHRRLP